MTKVFISIPMSGRDDTETIKRMDKLAELVKNLHNDDVRIINRPDREMGEVPENADRLWYLGHAVMLMSQADVIVFASDYRQANGCKIERYITQVYDSYSWKCYKESAINGELLTFDKEGLDRHRKIAENYICGREIK